MKNILFQIVDQMNTFNYTYCMIDSNKEYNRYETIENNLLAALKECSPVELKEIFDNLDTWVKDVKHSELLDFIKNNMEQPKSKLSVIMSTAWTFIKDGLVSTMSAALKLAWKRYKLVSKLKTGIASFSFKKATGELRQAIGTLRNGNFDYTPKTTDTKINLQIVKYFDINSNGWRSCRIDRLIEVAA